MSRFDRVVGQHIHTVLFAVSLGLYLGWSRHGSSLPVVLTWLAVYLLFGLIWVGREIQKVEHGDAKPGLHPRLAGGLLAAGLVAALACFLARSHWTFLAEHDGIFIVAVVAAYLGGGSLVMDLRRRTDDELGSASATDRDSSRPAIRAAITMAGALVVAALLTELLPHAMSATRWIGLGIAVCLLALPVALSVVVGRCVTAIAAWKSLPILILSIIGAGLAVSCTVLLASQTHDWKPIVIGSVVLAVVVFSIASETQLDTVLALAVVGLLGAARPSLGVDPSTTPANGSNVLVSLGDSYMSGEGAKAFYDGTNSPGPYTATHNQCRRAPTAWAPLASAEAPFTGFVFLACSGAQAEPRNAQAAKDAAADPSKDNYLSRQIAHYQGLGRLKPRLVVVSLGGNDAGFSTVGTTCIAPGNCAKEADLFYNMLPTVEDHLNTAYAAIRHHFRGVPVVAIPYPMPISTTSGACTETTLSPPERRFIRSFLSRLDDTVQAAAQQAGFWYLSEMKDSLARVHEQLCDPLNYGSAGINFLHLRSVTGLADERFNPANWVHDSLHPNEAGHKAMLETFASWLAGHQALLRTNHPQVSPPGTPATQLASKQPKTDLKICLPTSDTAHGCLPEAKRWALGQAVGLVWPYALEPLGLTAGLGLLWAGVLGYLRRRRETNLIT